MSARAQEIWQEFLADGAPSSINLDSHSFERTSQNLRDPGRYSYEDAQVDGVTHDGTRVHDCMCLELYFLIEKMFFHAVHPTHTHTHSLPRRH